MNAAEKASMRAVAEYGAKDGGGREWYNVPPDNFDCFYSLVRLAARPYGDCTIVENSTKTIILIVYYNMYNNMQPLTTALHDTQGRQYSTEYYSRLI